MMTMENEQEMQENPYLCFGTNNSIEKLSDSLQKGIFHNHRLPGFKIYGINDQVAPDTPQDCLIELARALHIFPRRKWKQLSSSAAQAFDSERYKVCSFRICARVKSLMLFKNL